MVEYNRRKTERKKLEKECMKLWQEIIKARAGNKCETCGRRENLNAHHVFSRSRQSTKYDIDNGISLCPGCHSLAPYSAHKDGEWLNRILGRVEGRKAIRTESWFQVLRRRAYTPQKLDLEMEKIYLEKKLEEIKAQHSNQFQ